MKAYNLLFFSILFFSLGIAIASLELSLLILLYYLLLAAIIYIFKRYESL